VETFKSRFRDEFLKVEVQIDAEAKLLYEKHRVEYNTYIPHSARQGSTPQEVPHQWKAA